MIFTLLLLAVTSDQIAVGTVSGLLIAVSTAVFRLYGTANDERKMTAESRVEQVEEELARAEERHRQQVEETSRRHKRDWDDWRRREAMYEAKIERLEGQLADCWERHRST